MFPPVGSVLSSVKALYVKESNNDMDTGPGQPTEREALDRILSGLILPLAPLPPHSFHGGLHLLYSIWCFVKGRPVRYNFVWMSGSLKQPVQSPIRIQQKQAQASSCRFKAIRKAVSKVWFNGTLCKISLPIMYDILCDFTHPTVVWSMIFYL